MTDWIEVSSRAEVNKPGDAERIIATWLRTESTEADRRSARRAALSLVESEEFEPAVLLWGYLFHAEPTNFNFAMRVLQCLRRINRKELFLDCLPNGCIERECWQEVSSSLGSLVRAMWSAKDPSRTRIMTELIDRKASSIAFRVTLLRCLHAGEAEELIQDWLLLEVAPATLVGLADLFELAGFPSAARHALSKFRETHPLNFHVALLGARIAAQTGDLNALDSYEGLCKEAASEHPEFAAKSHVFHLLFFNGYDSQSVELSTRVLCEALTEGRITASSMLRYFPAIECRAGGALLLEQIAAGQANEVQARPIRLLARMIEGRADHSEVLKACSDNLWEDTEAAARLVARTMSEITERDHLARALQILSSTDFPTQKAIRDCALAWQSVGRFELAGLVWEFLVRLNPKDDGARMNAIYCLHEVGEKRRAKELAESWDVEGKNPAVLVHIATSLARVGNSDRALELFRRADAGLCGANPPPQISEALARGLMLYGDYSAAMAHLPERGEPGRQTSAAVILDPGHTDASGHHANYNAFFSDFIYKELGTRPDIIIGVKEPGRSLSGHRIFRRSFFEPYVYNAFTLGSRELHSLNTSFFYELESLFGDDVPELLVIHSMRAVMLSGFIRWLEGIKVRPRRLIVGLIEADHLSDSELSRIYTEELSEPLAKLCRIEVDNLILFAETDIAVSWLQNQASGITIHKLPYLAAARAEAAARPRASVVESAPTFGILGATRQERGFNLIFKAIFEYPVADQRWRIQANEEALSRFGDDTGSLMRGIENSLTQQVSFIRGFLSIADYYNELKKIDCLVLPYSGRYSVSGSGVLYEAIYGRKYVIVSESSTLARELESIGYPHHAIDISHPKALAEAVTDVVGSWAHLTSAVDEFFRKKPRLPLNHFEELFSRGFSA